MKWIQTTSSGVLVAIKLVPRSSVNRIDGLHGEALKIRLNAPPVDGKANAALLRFLADTLGVPMARVALKTGETSRQKTVLVTGLTEETIRSRLQPG